MKKIISHVVALSNNNVIGVDNMLPWNLKTDLQHFKNYTTNKILLMGRKTYESIGRPLPKRINYVISTTIDKIDGAEVFKSIDEALDAANKKCDESDEYSEIVIIGGGYLFRDTIEITNKLVLTNVNCEIEGDVFYPKIDFNEWQEKSSENFLKDMDNDYDFKVRILERV